MGVCSNHSIRLLIISFFIGVPWFVWLFFNWPSRTRLGIPVYFDFQHEQPTFETNFTSSYGIYDLELEMEVPTSPNNQNLGQFMVETELREKNRLFFNSRRPALLTYTSAASHLIRDFLFCLLDLFHFAKHTNSESFVLGKRLMFKYAQLTMKLQLSTNKVEIYHAILWVRQRDITWLWLGFYSAMLGAYLVFLLLVGIFLIRAYFRSHVQMRRRTRSKRRMLTHQHHS